MKKLIYHICIIAGFVLLWGCSQPETTPEAGSPEATGQLSLDTSGAAVVEEEQDTTLQHVQELTLRALGNTLEEIAFSEDTLYAKAGSLVRLTFINEGKDMPMVHNVVFTTAGKFKEVALAGAKIGAPGNYVPKSPDVIAATPIALPGQTVVFDFKAPTQPGVYDFVCTYPEHYQRMNGILIVK